MPVRIGDIDNIADIWINSSIRYENINLAIPINCKLNEFLSIIINTDMSHTSISNDTFTFELIDSIANI
jgi:hypothetical protein